MSWFMIKLLGPLICITPQISIKFWNCRIFTWNLNVQAMVVTAGSQCNVGWRRFWHSPLGQTAACTLYRARTSWKHWRCINILPSHAHSSSPYFWAHLAPFSSFISEWVSYSCLFSVWSFRGFSLFPFICLFAGLRGDGCCRVHLLFPWMIIWSASCVYD